MAFHALLPSRDGYGGGLGRHERALETTQPQRYGGGVSAILA